MSDRILVTGGAGYIGSHACKALAKAGYEPVTYDNLSRGHDWAVKWGPLEQGDIRDGSRLRTVIERYRPTAVMHFAAFGNAGESMQHPELYWDNNVGGTVSLLSAMLEGGVRKLVFSGSCSVYGETGQEPLHESLPKKPVSVYGQTKLVGETMLDDCVRNGDLQAVSLRYFNAAGADPDGDIGEAHEPELHLLPNILAAARDGSALTVFGNNYPTPDGTCVRDYIHVSDLANAHVKALLALDESRDTLRAYNLGTTTGNSILECINAAGAVTGSEISIEYGPRRHGDPPFAVANASLAKDELDWSPQYADINDILATAWRWMQRNEA